MFGRLVIVSFAFALVLGCGDGAQGLDLPVTGTAISPPEAPSVGAPVECLTDSECGAKLETSDCVPAYCNGGKCATRNADIGALCSDADGSAGECESLACDGAGSCAVVAALNGQPCAGGTICNPKQCSSGQCVDGKAIDCYDGNACTDDLCDPAKGCVFEYNSADCDDGDPCTENDACSEGFCASGELVCECEADKDCALKDSDLCDGILVCNENKKCVNDLSQAVSCVVPDDLGQCENLSCNPSTGKCETGVNAGAPCDDGDSCSQGDYCVANGNCVEGNTYLCEICDNDVDDNGDDKVDCEDALCEEYELCVDPGTTTGSGSTGDGGSGSTGDGGSGSTGSGGSGSTGSGGSGSGSTTT